MKVRRMGRLFKSLLRWHLTPGPIMQATRVAVQEAILRGKIQSVLEFDIAPFEACCHISLFQLIDSRLDSVVTRMLQ